MKRSLLLLSILFFSVACRQGNNVIHNFSKIPLENAETKEIGEASKDNAETPKALAKVEQAAVVAPEPFKAKIFLAIHHEDSDSLLRRKLLNILLNRRIQSKLEFLAKDEVHDGDEFQFADKSKSVDVNRENYKNQKTNFAEVVVSFKNRLEFYFVPTGISRKNLLSQIAGAPVANSVFYWLDESDGDFEKNKTYYLTNASSIEMKENDIYFNHETIGYYTNFTGNQIHVFSNQILEFAVYTEYYDQETTMESKEFKRKKCSMEDGNCSCNYQIEKNTGRNIKKVVTSIDQVGLYIKLDGKQYSLRELNAHVDALGTVLIRMEMKKYLTTSQSILEMVQVGIPADYRDVYSVNSTCIETFQNRIDLTHILNVLPDITFIGRGLDF